MTALNYYCVERGQKQSYSAVIPSCDVNFGRHSHADYTFLMEDIQYILIENDKPSNPLMALNLNNP